MILGLPKEIKDNEYRVALTPAGVYELTRAGHRVLVEKAAGAGSGFPDSEYAKAGGEIVATAAEAYQGAEMVVKVKEPLPEEYPFLRENLILFTYLHLAAAPELGKTLLEKKIIGVGYETVETDDHGLPLLTPMSEVAGRMAIQIAAQYLEKTNGGRGIVLGGVAGVKPANVVIVGGGVVGKHAAEIAIGMGAHVTIIDSNIDRLRHLNDVLEGGLTTLASTQQSVAEAVRQADVVIGAVLITGGKAPRLVTKAMIETMVPGSVVIDVSVDQGGCVETCHPTTHSEPTYLVNDVVHYCVANMPGAVPRTSTMALSNATLPYIMLLATQGFAGAVQGNLALARGVNIYKGHVTHAAVAEALGQPYQPLLPLLDS